MEMTMRWFGKDYDTVTLEQIKQTRYATGIITTLYNKMPGEVWNLDEILAMKKEVALFSNLYSQVKCLYIRE